jgi:hypothetical protein
MNWKNYENLTAELFRNLGCQVEFGPTVDGARARHKIDVLVKFSRFGIEATWVVDCKFWRKPVTKEKVLALKSVVDDIGADRGLLVSERGFQAGAVRAAGHANITLTSLEQLRETAQTDLILSALHALETRAIAAKYGLHELWSTEQTGPQSISSKPLPGVDGKAVMRAAGRLSVLEFGFERARLNKPPFLVEFNDVSDQRITALTLEQFIECAAAVIATAEATLKQNQPKTDV